MYPHVIRLRGPWQVEPVGRPARRINMPGCWQTDELKDFDGRVRFRRRFGYPGRIDLSERVWLTLSKFSALTEIRLNGVLLGSAAQAYLEFPITELLQERNELLLEVDARLNQGAAWGEVALEVRATAYLRHVLARSERVGHKSSLQVTGEVAGSADRPLDLYVLVDGATRHYSTISPSPEGMPFCVLLEEEGLPDESAVRVELVNGGVLWYVVRCRSESTPPPPGR
jgi:hypothetical protein